MKKLFLSFVDPTSLFLILECRLVALRKNQGVHPNAVCETVRGIIVRAVLFITQVDILESSGSLSYVLVTFPEWRPQFCCYSCIQ